MRVLVTHPGKIGDLLWALPTVRAIAERTGEKVALLVPPSLAGVGKLLELQPYIHDVVVDKWWEVQDTAPVTPRVPPALMERRAQLADELGFDPDRIVHMGYNGWPKMPLAVEANDLARIEMELSPLDLERPWIEAPTAEQAEGEGDAEYGEVSVGFTDEWGELKLGILHSVSQQHFGGRYSAVDFEVLCPVESRWNREFAPDCCVNVFLAPGGWMWAAYVISRTQVFLGCLSSMAVLAKALGKPRVLVEPNPHRHHMIFQHPDQSLVVGNDGLPTFDARHVGDALHRALARRRKRERALELAEERRKEKLDGPA